MNLQLPPHWDRLVRAPETAQPGQIILLWPDLPPQQAALPICENCGSTGEDPGLLLTWQVARTGEAGASLKWFGDRRLHGHILTTPCPVCAGTARDEFLLENCGLQDMRMDGRDALKVKLDMLCMTPAQERARGLAAGLIEDLTRLKGQYRSPSFFVSGPYGTGKTVTLVALVNAARLAGVYARYTTAQRLMDDLRATLHAHSATDTTSAIAALCRIPLLAIDELDRVNCDSAWVRSVFFDLLDKRLSGPVMTAAASNHSLTALSDALEPLPAIASRLSAGLVCELEGEDLRLLTGLRRKAEGQ